MTGSEMQLAYLSETQNAAFDSEYHRPEEMAQKVTVLKERWPTSLDILDLGGGNGVFLDQLLDAIPYGHGTNLDISRDLLEANKPHDRKALRHGSVEHLERIMGADRFDVITVNWVLHHLVGPDDQTCERNVIAALEAAKRLLKPGGAIFVAETMVEGPLKTDMPGRLIYEITRVKHPLWIKVARKVANTAGVGVRFHSQKAWERLFKKAGLRCETAFYGPVWRWPLRRQLLHLGVGLVSQQHRHVLLESVHHGVQTTGDYRFAGAAAKASSECPAEGSVPAQCN